MSNKNIRSMALGGINTGVGLALVFTLALTHHLLPAAAFFAITVWRFANVVRLGRTMAEPNSV